MKNLFAKKQLMKSDRCHSPCNVCDVNGTLNGKNLLIKWKSFTRKT